MSSRWGAFLALSVGLRLGVKPERLEPRIEGVLIPRGEKVRARCGAGAGF